MRIGIVCAMQKEYDLLKEWLHEGGDVLCELSGIGKVNAAMSAEHLISGFAPDCVLSIGCAGTFAEGVEEGDTIIVSRSAYHDVWCGDRYAAGQVAGQPLFFDSDPELLARARESLPEAKVGLLCTGDQFYISEEEDMRQKSLFPDALAVDMEGAAVAQVSRAHGIPFLAVKVISDNHLYGHQRERYDNFWNGLAEKSFVSVREILKKLR